MPTCGCRYAPKPETRRTELPPPAPAGEGTPASKRVRLPYALRNQNRGGGIVPAVRVSSLVSGLAASPPEAFGLRAFNSASSNPGGGYFAAVSVTIFIPIPLPARIKKEIIIIIQALCQPDPPPRKSRDASLRPASGDSDIRQPMPISRRGHVGSAFYLSEAKTLFSAGAYRTKLPKTARRLRRKDRGHLRFRARRDGFFRRI